MKQMKKLIVIGIAAACAACASVNDNAEVSASKSAAKPCCCKKSAKAISAPKYGVQKDGSWIEPTDEEKLKMFRRSLRLLTSRAYKDECKRCKAEGRELPVKIFHSNGKDVWVFTKKDGTSYEVADKKGVYLILERKAKEIEKRIAESGK